MKSTALALIRRRPALLVTRSSPERLPDNPGIMPSLHLTWNLPIKKVILHKTQQLEIANKNHHHQHRNMFWRRDRNVRWALTNLTNKKNIKSSFNQFHMRHRQNLLQRPGLKLKVVVFTGGSGGPMLLQCWVHFTTSKKSTWSILWYAALYGTFEIPICYRVKGILWRIPIFTILKIIWANTAFVTILLRQHMALFMADFFKIFNLPYLSLRR